ncbi:MAG: SphA family protein [Flavobacterium sp.]|jgi:hypothetical protein|uniref:SphA family protein n=1 Tax=Flavobacterium sp. TaxID=239 RepID=UPI003BA68EB7
MNKIVISSILIFITISNISNAQGHYNGGSFNTNDYFIPSASGWVFSLYYSFSEMNYYNDSGDKTDRIEINENPPFSVELGQKVKTHSIIPMISYFAKTKVLNAKWGILALPMLNNPNANIALDFYSEQSLLDSKKIDFNSFGLGDFYLQPIWLTWEKKKFSTTFSYGTWIPVGKYAANSTENVGLGYWSHNIRVMGRYKPKDKISLSTGLTYEINSKQKGTDFKEAPHLTLDYGASYSFMMGHEIGLFGFGTWETGDDRGEKAVLDNDQIYGLGCYGSYWFKPGKLGILARYTSNFGTRNRFGGASFQLGINYLLF